MVRLILAGLAALLAAAAGFIGYRTFSFTAPPPPAAVDLPDTSAYAIDASAAAMRLGEAIRFRTVSLVQRRRRPRAVRTIPRLDAAALSGLSRRRAARGDRRTVAALHLGGQRSGQPPIVLLAHQDVVPVPDDTRQNWNVDPFGGVIRDDAVWGRGAIDDKGSLVALAGSGGVSRRARAAGRCAPSSSRSATTKNSAAKAARC